jgi:uncharacterized membrane protein YkoI
MIKKSIPVLLVVVAVLGVALVAYGFPNSKNTTISTNSNQPANVLVSNTTNNTTAKNADNVISSEEAKKIASNYIEQSGATAGTPQLVNQDGKKVYVVPVIYNGTNAGEIDIDALTGQNLGGAGGV